MRLDECGVDLGVKWQLATTMSTRTQPEPRNKNFPGAIKITGDGRYFFITNRGDDNIALFAALPDGNIQLLKLIPSHGKYPSDLLLKQQGNSLTVINFKSGSLTKFKSATTPSGLIHSSSVPLNINRGIGLCH